jgi:heat shock protein HslJ
LLPRTIPNLSVAAITAISCFGVLIAQNTSQHTSAAVPISITETHWNLIELDGNAIAAVTSGRNQPYIYLQRPGDKISGSGGCNRLFGTFDLSGNSLQFHSVASTRMACADNSMANEAALLEALKLTTSFQLDGNVLQLRVDDRILARFQADSK